MQLVQLLNVRHRRGTELQMCTTKGVVVYPLKNNHCEGKPTLCSNASLLEKTINLTLIWKKKKKMS